MTTINSIEDLNIVVTNMDVINGQINVMQKPLTVRTSCNSESYDQVNGKKMELGAKVISKSRNRKPPILTKAQNNRIAPSTTSVSSQFCSYVSVIIRVHGLLFETFGTRYFSEFFGFRIGCNYLLYIG